MEIGQVVYSLCGHDSKGYFVVIDIKDKFVYICNGKLRTLEKPKKKNIAHVKATKTIFVQMQEELKNNELSNAKIRKMLSNFNYNKGNLEGEEV